VLVSGSESGKCEDAIVGRRTFSVTRNVRWAKEPGAGGRRPGGTDSAWMNQRLLAHFSKSSSPLGVANRKQVDEAHHRASGAARQRKGLAGGIRAESSSSLKPTTLPSRRGREWDPGVGGRQPGGPESARMFQR